jgi:hypothetical protein
VPPKKPPTLQLPPLIVDEIRDIARRAQRSVAFVVHRALLAAKDAPPAAKPSHAAPLPLSTDDEDPPNLLAKLPAAAAGRPLDEAVLAAWPIAREKFQAWLTRLEEAAKAEQADDLDSALAEAANPATLPARLTELSRSEYPKVRALVAAHANAPADVLARLEKDREPYIRQIISARA